MADEVLDLSDARKVRGVTQVFTCRKYTNEVAARFRAAEREADRLTDELARQQAKLERNGKVTDPDEWERIEAEIVTAQMGVIVPLLLAEDGTEPTVETLKGEFTSHDVQIIVGNCIRPTVPDWAKATTSG